MTEDERGAAGIESLPEDLVEAIHLAEGSEVLREALGDHVHEYLIRNKREEWDAFKAYVTPVRAGALPPHPLSRTSPIFRPILRGSSALSTYGFCTESPLTAESTEPIVGQTAEGRQAEGWRGSPR